MELTHTRPRRKRRTLTERQRKLLKLVLAHPEWTGMRLCIEAGYSPRTARAMTTRNLAKIEGVLGVAKDEYRRELKLTTRQPLCYELIVHEPAHRRNGHAMGFAQLAPG